MKTANRNVTAAAAALMLVGLPGCVFPVFPGYDVEECGGEYQDDCADEDDAEWDDDADAEDVDDDGNDAEEQDDEVEEPENDFFAHPGTWVGTCYIDNDAEVDVELEIDRNGLGEMELDHAGNTLTVNADGWSEDELHWVTANVGDVQFHLELTTSDEGNLTGVCQQRIAETYTTGGTNSDAAELACTIFTLGLANCGGTPPTVNTRWVVEHEGQLELVEMS